MERVVLVDDSGAAVGTADKASVHHVDTPLHLAFSAYVFNSAGELLLTRRAPTKRTWPNVWTNSCCGHPGPSEPLPEAIARRLGEELQLTATSIDLVLPRFRYRATMPNGIVENELCPVFRVRGDGEPTPNPAEVAETRWVPWRDFVTDTLGSRRAVSPWCLEQIRALSRIGARPDAWSTAAQGDLPAAARVSTANTTAPRSRSRSSAAARPS